MAKKKGPSRYVGSCGIYVGVRNGAGRLQLLVQRRSRQVSEPNTLCSPGGIVERPSCETAGPGSFNFEAGAKTTALQELKEETGLAISPNTPLIKLPVCPSAYWGADLHRNYLLELPTIPKIVGPEKASKHEVVAGGLNGVGLAAGDGYHAWVDISELFARQDLMKGCGVPLRYLLTNFADGSPAEQDSEEVSAESQSQETVISSLASLAATQLASHPAVPVRGSLAAAILPGRSSAQANASARSGSQASVYANSAQGAAMEKLKAMQAAANAMMAARGIGNVAAGPPVKRPRVDW